MDELEVKLSRAAEAGESIMGYEASALLDAMKQSELPIEVAIAGVVRATKASLGRLWNVVSSLTSQNAEQTRIVEQGMLQYFDMQYLMEIVDSNAVVADIVE